VINKNRCFERSFRI